MAPLHDRPDHLTREQAERRQAKAVRFLRDVADDPDLADEIEDLSVSEYVARKGFELIDNPTRKKRQAMKKEDLQEIKNGLAEVRELLRRRSNPDGPQQVARRPAAEVKSDKEKILDRVDDAAGALAGGDEDEALDTLNGLLDDYDDE